MTLCAKCKKNPAVFFITKMENGKTTSEGLCLSCAKELGIAPINQMIDNFGVSDEELENINNQMSEFMESMEGMPGMDGDLSEMLGQISGGEDDEGGAATAPLDAFKDFFNNLGSNSNSDESTEENKREAGDASGGTERRFWTIYYVWKVGTHILWLPGLWHIWE